MYDGKFENFSAIRTRKDLLATFDSVLLGNSLRERNIGELELLEEIYMNGTKVKFSLRKFLIKERYYPRKVLPAN